MRLPPTKTSSGRGPGIAALVLGGLTIWELTYPFNFQSRAVTPWLGEVDIHKLNTLGNVALFMPWAVAAAWWGRCPIQERLSSRVRVVVAVTLLGAVLSLLAETVQVWLPDRHSSIVDLLANTLGSCVGASLGFSLAPGLERCRQRWRDQFQQWSATRCLAWACLAMLVVRTAPFDLAPETRELRLVLNRSVEAGMPFSAARRAWAGSALPPPVLRSGDSAPRSAATELTSAACALAVFILVGYALARAIRQRFTAKRDRSSPIPFAFLFASGFVLITEIMKWPIHSRIMNTTDLVCGLLGALLGVAVESALAVTSRQPNTR